MGKKKLNYWDRNAPYPNQKEVKISWNDAKKIVVNAYSEFDSRFGKVAKLFFDKSWIHAKVKKGKHLGHFLIQLCRVVILAFC